MSDNHEPGLGETDLHNLWERFYAKLLKVEEAVLRVEAQLLRMEARQVSIREEIKDQPVVGSFASTDK
jgi:hypothetical protein